MVEARRMLLALGRERWSQKANQLGVLRGKTADTISYLAREGVRQPLEDDDFVKRNEALDQALFGDFP